MNTEIKKNKRRMKKHLKSKNQGNNPQNTYSPRAAFLKDMAQKKEVEEKNDINEESEPEVNYSFESLRGIITEDTMKGIDEMGFKNMTPIQAKCIPKLLEGKDVRGTAKTGSGKTLAFLIPVVELMAKLKYTRSHGTGAIIVSPTRELALQIFGVLKQLLKYHKHISCGIVMGGSNINAEFAALLKGASILVATPGRLLDHLKNTEFKFSEMICFVIDEADEICSVGFEADLRSIISLIPKERQTILFSATNNAKTDKISTLALKNTLLEVDISKDQTVATVEGLDQYYVMCPIDSQISLLRKFLLDRTNEKGMVFFNSCNVVKFYYDILEKMKIPVTAIHGRLNQKSRTKVFEQFKKDISGALLCTNVAARGWDIPSVNWILQVEVPDEPKEYLHRVGRTARAGNDGKSIIFLTEQEKAFLRVMKTQNVIVNVKELEINWSDVKDIQKQVITAVNKVSDLKESAFKAYKAYVRNCTVHKLKKLLGYETLELKKVARNFGLMSAPNFNLNLTHRKRKKGGGKPPVKRMKKT